VPTPVMLFESSMMTPLFWMSLPVVESNLTTALSVAPAGPTTSPVPPAVADNVWEAWSYERLVPMVINLVALSVSSQARRLLALGSVRLAPVPPLAKANWPVTVELPRAMVNPEPVAPPVNVPTLVRDELTTVEWRVVLVRVLASAVTVMLPVPSKLVPLMVLGVARAVAVEALPVRAPMKVTAVKASVVAL
jgi:hypothetical protein